MYALNTCTIGVASYNDMYFSLSFWAIIQLINPVIDQHDAHAYLSSRACNCARRGLGMSKMRTAAPRHIAMHGTDHGG